MAEDALVKITVPDWGLPADETVRVSAWLARKGDAVYEGDRVVELHAHEVTLDISSPASGQLIHQAVGLDQPVTVGQVLGVIERA